MDNISTAGTLVDNELDLVTHSLSHFSKTPLLKSGEETGALGFWQALNMIWSSTDHEWHCGVGGWVYKKGNVLGNSPSPSNRKSKRGFARDQERRHLQGF